MCYNLTAESWNSASWLRCLHYLDRKAENITTMSLCVTPSLSLPNPLNLTSWLRYLHYLDRRAENITTMSLCVTPSLPNPGMLPPGLGTCIILIGELKISQQCHYVLHLHCQILVCCLPA